MIRIDSPDLPDMLVSLPVTLSTRTEEELFSLSDPSPAAIITVKEDPWGPIGFLAIDTLVCGKCSGGTRMTPDITEQEVIHLARAMTLKFAFKNSAIGGAKSGILLPPGAGEREKKEILEVFGRQLGPVMKALYGAGGDIGVGSREVKIIKKAAGIDARERPADKKAGFCTALGVFLSARTLAQKRGMRPEDCRVAIEGYGKVGRPLVRLFQQAGFKTVALSTIHGGIHNPMGLDADVLEKAADEHGDYLVQQLADADKIESTSLFTVDADMVIPGARPWTIREDNADQLKAAMIVTAANIPVTRGAARILHEKGIPYIPDFVSTGGGIMGCSLMNQGFSLEDVIKVMDSTFTTKITRLLDLAGERKISVEDMAVQIARNNFVRLRDLHAAKNKRVRYFFLKLRQDKSLLPMVGRAAQSVYQRNNGKIKFLGKMLRSTAVSHAIRNATWDVRHYPETNA